MRHLLLICCCSSFSFSTTLVLDGACCCAGSCSDASDFDAADMFLPITCQQSFEKLPESFCIVLHIHLFEFFLLPQEWFPYIIA